MNRDHFPLIHGNTIRRDDVAQKFHRRLLECAFLIFGVKTVFPKSLTTPCEHVAHVGKHVPPDGRCREPAHHRTGPDRYRPIGRTEM